MAIRKGILHPNARVINQTNSCSEVVMGKYRFAILDRAKIERKTQMKREQSNYIVNYDNNNSMMVAHQM